MARLPRIVIPDHPHHVTQRGNRREPVFFCEADYRLYLDLLRHWAAKAGTQVWAYCLMPNHVHLILTPRAEDGLRATLSETHRRYTRHINFREGWRGHLWQERFHSFPMDEQHLLACARYIAVNPVAAGLVARPQGWAWSSAKAHLSGVSDGVIAVEPLTDRIGDWQALLDGGADEAMDKRLEMHLRTGRPLGSEDFIKALEARLGKPIRPGKPGRPRQGRTE